MVCKFNEELLLWVFLFLDWLSSKFHEPSPTHYLPIVKERRDGSSIFPMVFFIFFFIVFLVCFFFGLFLFFCLFFFYVYLTCSFYPWLLMTLSIEHFMLSYWSAGTSKSWRRFVLLFNWHYLVFWDGFLDSICIRKSKIILCVWVSRSVSTKCKYDLSTWPNFRLLHYSQWITFHTHSCLSLYFLCQFVVFFVWLTVSSQSSRDWYLLFCVLFLYFHIISPFGIILCCF